MTILKVNIDESWLKEFFDDEYFVLKDTKAVINVQDGLLLADTARVEREIQGMGVIGINESSSTAWILTQLYIKIQLRLKGKKTHE